MRSIERHFDRELTPSIVLDVLANHAGAAAGISARDLVRKICGISVEAGERRLRSMIEQLRLAGHPIAATPANGYFLARTDAELDETCEFLYARAMTSLQQVAALRRVALPDLRGQLRLLPPKTVSESPASSPPPAAEFPRPYAAAPESASALAGEPA